MEAQPNKEQYWHKSRRWQVGLSVLAALALIGYVWLHGLDYSNSRVEWRKWASWTGFGESTTIAERTEKDGKGNVKITDTKQPAKTLWDWMELLLVPGLLALLTFQLQRIETERAGKQAASEAEIAESNLRHQALQAYFDSMSLLLLEHRLDISPEFSPVRQMARARTLTILRRLDKDGVGKGSVMRFLSEAGLLGSGTPLNLEDADLKGADLRYVKLNGAKLSHAKLQAAKLEGADLSGADLADAELNGADLRGAQGINTLLSFNNEYWKDAYLNPEDRESLELLSDKQKAGG